MAPSLTELSAKVDTLTAQVDEKEKEHKDAMDEKEKEHKEAMDDMEKKNHDGMEDEHKKTEEAKKAMEDEKKHHDAVLKAVLKAMEEEDPEKRKEAIKQAQNIEHKDDVHHEAEHLENEKDEEKKAMKAQLDYQDKIIKKPKLQILEAAYTGAGVGESKVKEYKADWGKMTAEQLDDAIEKAQPIIEMTGRSIETPEPLGLSKGLSEFSGSTKTGNEEYSAKVEKMSPAELFA